MAQNIEIPGIGIGIKFATAGAITSAEKFAASFQESMQKVSEDAEKYLGLTDEQLEGLKAKMVSLTAAVETERTKQRLIRRDMLKDQAEWADLTAEQQASLQARANRDNQKFDFDQETRRQATHVKALAEDQRRDAAMLAQQDATRAEASRRNQKFDFDQQTQKEAVHAKALVEDQKRDAKMLAQQSATYEEATLADQKFNFKMEGQREAAYDAAVIEDQKRNDKSLAQWRKMYAEALIADQKFDFERAAQKEIAYDAALIEDQKRNEKLVAQQNRNNAEASMAQRKYFEEQEAAQEAHNRRMLALANNVGSRGGVVGRASNLAGGAALGLAAVGVGTAMEAGGVDQAAVVATNTSGLPLSQMRSVRNEAIRLATRRPIEVKDALAAITTANDLKIFGQSQTELLNAGTDLSVAVGENPKDTVTALARTGQMFGRRDWGKMAQMLYGASTSGRTTAPDLVEGGLKAFQAASPLHMDLGQTLAGLSALTPTATSPQQAGTMLAGLIQQTVKPSKQSMAFAEEMQKETGVKLTDIFGNSAGLEAHGISGLIDMFREVSQKKGWRPARLISQLYPQRYGRGAGSALADTEYDTYQTALASENRQGDLSARAQAATDTLPGQWQLMKNQAQRLAVDFSDAGFMSDTKKLVSGFSGWLTELEKLDSASKGRMAHAVEALAIGLGAIAIIGKFVQGAAAIIGFIGGIKGAGALAGAGGAGAGAEGAAAGVAGAAGVGKMGQLMQWLKAVPGLAGAVVTAPVAGVAGAGLVAGVGGTKIAHQNILRSQAEMTGDEAESRGALLRLLLPDEVKLKRMGPNDPGRATLQHKVDVLQQTYERSRGEARAIDTETDKRILKALDEYLASPTGKATCAAFVVAKLRQAGIKVPEILGAADLSANLQAHGAKIVPNRAAEPGDIAVFHGPGMGVAKDRRGWGYHIGMVNKGFGPGAGVLSSSGGHLHQGGLYPRGSATTTILDPSNLDYSGESSGGALGDAADRATQEAADNYAAEHAKEFAAAKRKHAAALKKAAAALLKHENALERLGDALSKETDLLIGGGGTPLDPHNLNLKMTRLKQAGVPEQAQSAFFDANTNAYQHKVNSAWSTYGNQQWTHLNTGFNEFMSQFKKGAPKFQTELGDQTRTDRDLATAHRKYQRDQTQARIKDEHVADQLMATMHGSKAQSGAAWLEQLNADDQPKVLSFAQMLGQSKGKDFSSADWKNLLSQQVGYRKDNAKGIGAYESSLMQQAEALKAQIGQEGPEARARDLVTLKDLLDKQALANELLAQAKTDLDDLVKHGAEQTKTLKDTKDWDKDHKLLASVGLKGKQLGAFGDIAETGLEGLMGEFVKSGANKAEQHGLLGNLAAGLAGGGSGVGGMIGNLGMTAMQTFLPPGIGSLVGMGVGLLSNLFGGGPSTPAPPKPFSYSDYANLSGQHSVVALGGAGAINRGVNALAAHPMVAAAISRALPTTGTWEHLMDRLAAQIKPAQTNVNIGTVNNTRAQSVSDFARDLAFHIQGQQATRVGGH